jgi:hypothetical protein
MMNFTRFIQVGLMSVNITSTNKNYVLSVLLPAWPLRSATSPANIKERGSWGMSTYVSQAAYAEGIDFLGAAKNPPEPRETAPV